MDTTDFSCDSDLLFDDLDVIRKRLSLSLNSTHSSPNTSHMEDDAPTGLRVMVVDDDTACLFITSIMLKRFNYKVTGVRGGKEALKLLKEKPNQFDLVITDLHMPEINGLQLLRRIKRKYATLPVLLMSDDIKAEMVTRTLENGCKPVTYSDFEKLWKHIIKSKVDPKGYGKDMEQTESFCQDSPREKQKSTNRVSVSASSEFNQENSRVEASRKRKEHSRERPGDAKRTRARSAAPKKRRVIWTVELHNHFLDAIEKLGVDNGVPKRILEYMRIPGLTRENVASHLQKYRIFVKNLVENNRDIELSTVKSLASRAFHYFSTDESTPISLPQNVSQKAPKYSFGSFQPGSEAGNFQGLNTQTHSSHLNASMVYAGFQLGKSSITPMKNNNNNKQFMASAQQPRPTTSIATRNANQEDSITVSPAQLILNMSMGGGRSGRGTMQLVHQQNLMRWRKNIQTTGPLNTSTRTVFESGNFQKQNNNALVANMGTTANMGSSSIGNSSQPSTLDSTNFTGIQIINDNANSSGSLHIGTIVSIPSNDNNIDNMDYGLTNRPTSPMMEVPGMIPELVGKQSSYSAIEEPNSNLDYLNNKHSVAPTEMSNLIPQPSALEDEAYFGGGIIPNANHESVAQPHETQVPTTVPVAPAPLAQHPEQAGEDEEDPFEGLYDLIRNDSNLGRSLPPFMDNYLKIEPSSVAPVEVSNPIPQPSCINTNGFTAPQDKASFGGSIIPNANHESIAPQEETQVPTIPVAPAPLVQEAQQPQHAWKDEEDPFEGLYDLIVNDYNLGSSFLPLMDNEDFAHFNTDKGGAMYGGEDFLNQPWLRYKCV